MAKNTVLVYTDWMEQLQELSMEERGIILTAILNYQLGDDLPELDKLLKMVFIPIRQSIDRDNAAYVVKCEKNRENGKLGGAPKGNQNAKKTTETSERLKKQPKQPDNDNDNDNDNDKDSGSGSEYDNENDVTPPQPPQQELSSFHEKQILDAWNKQGCTQCIYKMTESRKRNILRCDGPERFINTIRTLNNQEYLMHQAKNGRPVSFDWFCLPENYIKVIEGNYKDIRGTGGANGQSVDWEAVGRRLDSLSKLQGRN